MSPGACQKKKEFMKTRRHTRKEKLERKAKGNRRGEERQIKKWGRVKDALDGERNSKGEVQGT